MSHTSRTELNAAHGHMNTEVRLGYQAALVSLESPTSGRLWLSVKHHPGDTGSCTQAHALVLAAEQRLGVCPRRRTDLLRQRLQQAEQALEATERRLEAQEKALRQAQERADCRSTATTGLPGATDDVGTALSGPRSPGAP